MADLITLSEFKAAMGISATDTRKDAMYTQMIPWASTAIRNYTERDFATASVTEVRNFEYDGSGYLDIDDATAITQVAFSVPSSTDIVLDSTAWYAAPARRDDSPVFYYIVIEAGAVPTSPYMGFERNLDVLYAEGRYPSVSRTAKVTGTWGWTTVPDDVKLACVWTISDWTSKTGPSANEGLRSEAIEGYSRSWGSQSGGYTALAIPNRARDLLARYQKVSI